MARGPGNGRLEEALATLIQNQAAFIARLAETDARMAEMNRQIEARFARIEALLLEHNRFLQTLPDAIREKIGFKDHSETPLDLSCRRYSAWQT
jgi:hypothetical protein